MHGNRVEFDLAAVALRRDHLRDDALAVGVEDGRGLVRLQLTGARHVLDDVRQHEREDRDEDAGGDHDVTDPTDRAPAVALAATLSASGAATRTSTGRNGGRSACGRAAGDARRGCIVRSTRTSCGARTHRSGNPLRRGIRSGTHGNGRIGLRRALDGRHRAGRQRAGTRRHRLIGVARLVRARGRHRSARRVRLSRPTLLGTRPLSRTLGTLPLTGSRRTLPLTGDLRTLPLTGTLGRVRRTAAGARRLLTCGAGLSARSTRLTLNSRSTLCSRLTLRSRLRRQRTTLHRSRGRALLSRTGLSLTGTGRRTGTLLPGLRSVGTAALGRNGLVVLGFVVGGTHVLISNCSRDASRRGLDTAPRTADRRCRRTAADRRCAQRTTRRSGRAGRTQERTPRESVRARCRYPFTRWRYDGSIPSTGDAGSWGRVAIPGRTTAPGDSSYRYGTPRPREPRILPGWRPDAPTLRECAPTRTPDRVCRRRPTRRGSTAPYGRWGTSHRCPVREISPPAADRGSRRRPR